MATIALYAAGAAIGGSMALTGVGIFVAVTSAAIGGAIGGAVGGVIDSQFIMPALFGSTSQSGPRLEELDIQTASEGSSIKKFYGPNCRAAGTIVWLPTLTEREDTAAGGKGGFGLGGGTSGTYYKYYANMYVVAGRAGSGGAVSRIKKIWAEGRLIYDGGVINTDTVLTSNQIQVDARPPSYLTIAKVFLLSPNGGPDLKQFVPGRDIVLSGFSGPYAGNNGTYRFVNSGDRSPGGTGTFLELQWQDTAVDMAAGVQTPTITQVAAQQDSLYEALAIYLGTLSQTVDPDYEANKGAGNAPAFRTWAGVKFKQLGLADFGNRVPQLSFLVEEAATRTVGETIGFILADAGLSPSEYETSACTELIDGYVIDGPTTAAQALEPLMLAYDISVRESNGKLAFFPRTTAPTVAVSSLDLAAHEPDTDYRRPMVLTDKPKYGLPSEVNVNYIDPDVNYTKASAVYRRTTFVRDNVVTVDLPVVMTAARARAIAKRLLMTAWAENRDAMLSLPPSYMNVEEGDLIGPIALGGQAYTIRVNDVTRGVNFRAEIQGTVTQTQTASQTPASMGSGAGISTPPYYPPVLVPLIMDIPALTESHATIPGVYFSTFALSRSATYASSQMLWSTDDLNFDLVGTMGAESVGGECLTTLGSATPGYWDLLRTLDVSLSHGDLENKTEAEVLAGQNTALVGGEIIGFQNATLLSPGVYRLSNLLRGLRNTERFIATHVAAEPFVLLSPSTTQLHTLNLATLSTLRYWRAVPSLGNVATAASTSPVLTAATVKPFAPCQVVATRDGSNNLTFNWQRRSRAIFRHFGTAPAPLLEEDERYELHVSEGGPPYVVKTIVGARTYAYSAAAISADGLDPTKPKSFLLYQVSLSTGRGFPTEEFSV